MSVDISTWNFVGLVRDTLGFSPSSRDDRDNAFVRIEWTGSSLRGSTHATSHGAVVEWTPLDGVVASADEPWSVLLPNARAKELIKTFDLKGPKGETMLAVDFDGRNLVVLRAGDAEEGVPAQRCTYYGVEDFDPPKPWEIFSDLGAPRPAGPVSGDIAALVALAAAAKRVGVPAELDSYTKGVRGTAGNVTAYWRHPASLEERQRAADAADEQAIVDESMPVAA